MAGAYYNSVENISTYAGYRWEYEDFGLEAAVVTDIPSEILFHMYVELTKILVALPMERGTVGSSYRIRVPSSINTV